MMSQMRHKNKALFITTCTQYLCSIDVFVTLRKMSIIFNMSVCPSARKKAPLAFFMEFNSQVYFKNDVHIQVALISDRNDGNITRRPIYIAQFFLEREIFYSKLCLMRVTMNRNMTTHLNESQILVPFSLQLSLHKETYLEQQNKF